MKKKYDHMITGISLSLVFLLLVVLSPVLTQADTVRPRKITIYKLTVFTSVPFKGDPMAVCLLETDYDNETLANIAAEMRFSETAFVRRLEEKPWSACRKFSLRWFTTAKDEVKVSGTGTLATAAALFREVQVTTSEVVFETLGGTITARKTAEGVAMNFSTLPFGPYKVPEAVLAALGNITVKGTSYENLTKKIIIQVAEEKEVRNLKPDRSKLLAAVKADEVRGIYVTTKGNPPYDFVSRTFLPWIGIDEAPVHGSAHIALAQYWAPILGKKEMFAYQASSRGGEIRMHLSEDGRRIDLIGGAVVFLKGDLYID